MKTPTIAAAVLVLSVVAPASACKPTQEWIRLGTEGRATRLYAEAEVVAYVRVTEVILPARPKPGAPPTPEYGLMSPGETAKVVVLESFKGPADFTTIEAGNTSCGASFRVGQEFIFFSTSRRIVNSHGQVQEPEIPVTLSTIRQLR
jgi:hypothetical protein